jgi:hypothetical protein
MFYFEVKLEKNKEVWCTRNEQNGMAWFETGTWTLEGAEEKIWERIMPPSGGERKCWTYIVKMFRKKKVEGK